MTGSQPDPGRELRGYINDVLARSDKLLGQQRTHAGGALDRPPAGLEPSRPLEQPGALMTVGGNAQFADDGLGGVDGGGGVGTLVRVNPDGDHGVLQAWGAVGGAPGGQT